MTRDEIISRYPHASLSFIRANLSADAPARAAVVERDPGNEPLAAGQLQGQARGRFLVRIAVCRHRLLDPDNTCEKFHVDLLRYAGIVPDDSSREIEIAFRQEKVGRKEPETTEITVERL